MPLTSGISVILGLVLVFCYGCVAASEKSQAREDAMRQANLERDDSHVSELGIEAEIPEDIFMDRYIFPSKCPQCLAELNLDEIKWVETNSALCPNCETLIEAEKI